MQTENYITGSTSNSSMPQSNVLSPTTQNLEKKLNSPSPKSSPKSSPRPTNSIANSLSNPVSSTNTSGTTTPTHNSHYPVQRRRSSVSTAPYTIPFKNYNGLQQSLNNNNNNNSNNNSTVNINNGNTNGMNINNNQTITGGPIHTHHYPTPTQTPQPTSQSQNINNINGCIPMLTREFVVRRISEGETGRLKEELKCEACGKGYKHISSLAKHLWEHTPEWQKTKKLLISKHQQVQLLEAASILCSMTDQNQSSSSSLSSPPAHPQGQAPPVHGTLLRKNRLVSMNGKSFSEENGWIKSGKEKFKHENIKSDGINNNGKENKLDSLNIDNVKSFNNTTSCLRKDSISKYPPLSSSRRGSLLGSLIKEEDSDAIADSDEEEHEREQELVASSIMRNGKEFSSVV